MKAILFIFFILTLSSGWSEPPVAWKGRFRPVSAYAQGWLEEFYHAKQIKREDLEKFPGSTPLELAWIYHFEGGKPFRDAPLFWIGDRKEKEAARLPLKQERFTPRELENVFKEKLEEFYRTETNYNPQQLLQMQLWNAGDTFRMLPSKYGPGEWVSLKALTWPVNNFTRYSDEAFHKIRTAYLALKKEPRNPLLREQLLITLEQAYAEIAGQVYLQGHLSQLSYPTLGQLKAESFYTQFPWIPLTVTLYLLAALLFFFKKPGLPILMAAFALHTAFLFLRCYILERPPVANMAETLIYVPWVAVALSLIFYRTPFSLLCGALIGGVLLSILNVTLSPALDNVQAVLNSQYWLTIHVLMVVASYGIFLLSGILSHFYLLGKKELSKTILQTMYLGMFLLIPGTILGGVWAAESWGRFWDWDPKESWAFISICVYLLVIHAYRFNRIGSDGLAIGGILGLQAIIFTWYGVNYILGTGLHTYGFGSGGELFYYLGFMLEIAFIVGFLLKNRLNSDQKSVMGLDATNLN